jgi:hypothetical protein
MLKVTMRRFPVCSLLACSLLLVLVHTASAAELKISAKALERTLRTQLFNGPDGRYYIRGDANSPCYVYVDSPHVSFVQDRIVVHVHTKAKLGTVMHGACVGVSLTREADVSLIPDAEGETIGFRDARIEHLSGSKELDFLLVPFLAHKLPQQMKVNAATLMRQLISRSTETTGYALSLTTLKIHSMIVDMDRLIVDIDATLDVD